MNQLKLQLIRYWLAMNASAFDSASHACMLYVAAAGTSPLDWKQFGLALLVAFVHGIRAYLKSNPVDKLLAQAAPSFLRLADGAVVALGPTPAPAVPAANQPNEGAK